MLKVISIDDSNVWDVAVKNFERHDIYYLSGYTKAFQLHGDGEPTLFYYDDGNTRAVNVVMKRDIAMEPIFRGKLPLNTYFDLATPYGYGGFLIEGSREKENLSNIFLEYDSYCRNNGIISEFVRFHPILNNDMGLESAYDVSTIGKTVSIELKSEEYVWSNFKSSNRNITRKAKKSGVKVYWGRNPKLIDEFMGMYNSVMDKDNAKEYYYFSKSFYDSILNDLKHNFLVFYSVYEDKIIAMSIVLFSNNQMHCHLSASIKEYLAYAPTNLLLYEASCWGVNNGYSSFHLGGGLGGKEDSLYRFKRTFNRDSYNNFSVGKKIFDREKYDELVEMRMKERNFDRDSSFFPIYRDEFGLGGTVDGEKPAMYKVV